MHAYLAPYIGFGWESCFSIQECPHKRDGWSTSQIAINIESEEPFSVPNSLRPWYQSYFAENIVRRGFHQDGEKFMLLNNPIASSDAFRLELKVRPTLYSCAMFYADSIANSPRERDVLIRTFLKASLEARFAHRLCLHMIIVTKDRKILLTERSPKLAEAQGQWSASAEEQLTRDDFGEGPDSVVRLWARRLLSEELSIPEDFYHAESIRILTIFLEADYLNVSLCGYATLNVKADDLEKHLRGSPRFRDGATDQEFTDISFLELGRDALLQEIFSPKRPWHFSSRYRLLYAFLKNFGEPSHEEIANYQLSQV